MATAQILIIGNEILTGRTQDTNSNYLAKALFTRGVRVVSIEVLPDDLDLIANWVKQKHALTDHTFICGGIGGTPDDITRQAVAKGLGLKLIRNPVAEKSLRDFYKDRINDDRLSMADMPEGTELINNSVTVAPGIKIKNIYVLAGIPQIMKAMFECIKDDLKGIPLYEEVLNLQVGEGDIARHMRTLNKEFPTLELGSYPTLDKDKGYRTQLVFRSADKAVIQKAMERFNQLNIN